MNLTDRLEQISATIRELRASAADGPTSRQLIDSLFRTVHSFKAAAAAAGRDDVSRAAHEFENLVHSLRTGKLSLDDEVLQALDDTVIALRDGSKTSSLDRLQQTEKLDSNALPPEFATLKDDERHRAAAAAREGANLYVMKVAFAAGDFDDRFRQLKEQLEKDAELISTSASMEDAKIIFQVFYASRSEKVPVRTVLQQTVLAGKAAARKLAKQINFVVKHEEFLLDKQSADVLTDALIHLARNAVDHGIESHGTVTIEAAPSQFVVTDDGRGIALENLPLIFQPGFSTSTEVTEFSGRGVGLDAVRTAVEELGGSVSVTSEPGKGASFIVKIPSPSSGA